MRGFYSISLRRSITLIIGVSFTLFTLIFAGFSFYTGLEKTWKARSFQLKSELAQAHYIMGPLVETGRERDIIHFVAAFASFNDNLLSLYVDHQGKVVGATKESLKGSSILELKEITPFKDQYQQVKLKGGAKVIDLRQNNQLLGLSQICENLGFARSKAKCGVLLRFIDLNPAINQLLADLINTTIYLLIAVMLVILLVVSILKKIIVDRSHRIIKTNSDFADGNEFVRCQIDGNDEIAKMAKSVDQLLDDIVQKRARLLRAQRLASLGDWEWNIKTKQLTWSDEVYRIFEEDPASFEVTYDNFLAKLHPDDVENLQLAVNKSLEKFTPYYIKHRLRLASNREKIVIERGDVQLNSKGVPEILSGTVLDVTEQEQLRLNAERANFAKTQFVNRMTHEKN